METLNYSLELFVMGHEYGHLMNRNKINTKLTKIGNCVINKKVNEWEKEYIADSIGIELAIEAMKSDYPNHPYFSYIWGPILFFKVMGYIDEAKSLYYPEQNLDVENQPNILPHHISEAIQYLSLDRQLWNH